MDLTEVIKEAKKRNICDEWHERMRKEPSVSVFCDAFFKGSDWAMEQNFPSVEILEQFPETEAYGLFVNKQYKGDAWLKMAFFGSSEVELEAKDYAVSQLYIRHDTRLKIKASGNAKVFINVLDNAQIEATATDGAKIVLYDYRPNGNIDNLTGNVKVEKRRI